MTAGRQTLIGVTGGYGSVGCVIVVGGSGSDCSIVGVDDSDGGSGVGDGGRPTGGCGGLGSLPTTTASVPQPRAILPVTRRFSPKTVTLPHFHIVAIYTTIVCSGQSSGECRLPRRVSA